ncbi:Clp protease N-terminal domain-containing protein [Yinghuangia seranimata]|uniref:Clp protease N-terminal domain-containing protein n=1 Tax=Yinghuangia seranimata TaxID=408067 RepID=UPI00248BFC1F|nr:Clp protease N-terminal domain-containing protein [Yinghuangia seranimata]MDI2131489.1 Clp protease N-terminal domain-containing protein [Yinghuangia seranimata]
MFERFTASARAVVRGSAAVARSSGTDRIGEEQLLLSLLDQPEGGAATVLAALGVEGGQRDAIARDLADARRRGGFTAADTEALASLGIDLDAVIERIEQDHGKGAFVGAGAGAGADGERRGLFGRGTSTRPVRMTGGAKHVLERALRESLKRGDKSLGTEHLLLAFVALPGVVRDTLGRYGVTEAGVTASLA